MLNFTTTMIGASSPKEMADFYEQVFDKKPEPEYSDPQTDWYGFQIETGFLLIGPHSDVSGKNPQPGRIMICFEAQDPKAEFDRIKSTGAKIVRDLESITIDDSVMQICTFEDPEGNYFQISSSM